MVVGPDGGWDVRGPTDIRRGNAAGRSLRPRCPGPPDCRYCLDNGVLLGMPPHPLWYESDGNGLAWQADLRPFIRAVLALLTERIRPNIVAQRQSGKRQSRGRGHERIADWFPGVG